MARDPVFSIVYYAAIFGFFLALWLYSEWIGWNRPREAEESFAAKLLAACRPEVPDDPEEAARYEAEMRLAEEKKPWPDR